MRASEKVLSAFGLAMVGTMPLCHPAVALEEIRYRLDWSPAGYHAPYYLAQQKGWFERAGLKVTINDGNGSTTAVQLVGANQFDVSVASLGTMAFARAKGMKVTSIAGIFRKTDLVLMVPEDSPIKGPQDARAKKLLYTASSQEAPFIDTFLAAGGVTRSQVELLNVDATAKISMFAGGNADGVFTVGNAIARVRSMRPARNIMMADFGVSVPGFGLVTSESTLQAKAALLRKFASVVAGAWTYVAKGRGDETVDEAVQAMLAIRANDRLNTQVMAGALKESLPFLFTKATADTPVGFQSEADWKETLALLEKTKMIGPGAMPKDYFTNEYLDREIIDAIVNKRW